MRTCCALPQGTYIHYTHRSRSGESPCPEAHGSERGSYRIADGRRESLAEDSRSYVPIGGGGGGGAARVVILGVKSRRGRGRSSLRGEVRIEPRAVVRGAPRAESAK